MIKTSQLAREKFDSYCKNSVLLWWVSGTNQLPFSSIAEILRRVVSLSEKEPFFFRVSARLANTKRHIVGEEMKWEHVTAIVFLVWHARFCKSVLLQGQVFVPMTCCVKFSWFEFMCHETGAKWYLVCTGRLRSRMKPFSSPEPKSFFWSRGRLNLTLFPKRNKHTHWFDCAPVSQVYFVDCENEKSYKLDMLCNSQNPAKRGVISTSFPPPS